MKIKSNQKLRNERGDITTDATKKKKEITLVDYASIKWIHFEKK